MTQYKVFRRVQFEDDNVFVFNFNFKPSMSLS